MPANSTTNIVNYYIAYQFICIADALFESKLDETSKKKAKDELNELNDKDRESAVQTLRKWVLEQDWLRSPTGE